jgi:PhnB protein
MSNASPLNKPLQPGLRQSGVHESLLPPTQVSFLHPFSSRRHPSKHTPTRIMTVDSPTPAPGTAAATTAEPAAAATTADPAPAPAVKAMPPSPTALPIVVVRDGPGALAFYERAFGAEVLARYTAPKSGKIMHAYVRVPLGKGGFVFALEEDGCIEELVATENVSAAAEGAVKGAGVYLYVCVGKRQVDGLVERVREAGGVVTMPARDIDIGGYECRVGKIVDPYGVAWSFADSGEAYAGDGGENGKSQE